MDNNNLEKMLDDILNFDWLSNPYVIGVLVILVVVALWWYCAKTGKVTAKDTPARDLTSLEGQIDDLIDKINAAQSNM